MLKPDINVPKEEKKKFIVKKGMIDGYIFSITTQ